MNVKSNHSFVPFENFVVQNFVHHYFLLLKLLNLVMMMMKVGIGGICEQRRKVVWIFCWSCWLLSYCLEKSLVMTIVHFVHFVVRFVVHLLNVFC